MVDVWFHCQPKIGIVLHKGHFVLTVEELDSHSLVLPHVIICILKFLFNNLMEYTASIMTAINLVSKQWGTTAGLTAS